MVGTKKQYMSAIVFMLGELLSLSAPTKAEARNVSYTPNLTGEKHTISTVFDQSPYLAYSPTQKKKHSFFQN